MGKILFCDVCGKILQMKNDNNLILAVCSCGFSKKIEELSFNHKIEKEDIGLGVFDDNEKYTPGYKHECPKCGFDECDIYDLGVQISDESSIILYRCKKCKFVERQADGSSIA